MALLNVKVGGKNIIVEAANKGTAKAYGRKQIEVTVTEATGAEVAEFVTAGNEIVKLETATKDAPEAAVEAAE